MLNVLKKPLPRVIYDYVLKSSLVEKLFDSLQDRQLIRNICRAGHKPNYPEVEYGLAQVGASSDRTSERCETPLLSCTYSALFFITKHDLHIF